MGAYETLRSAAAVWPRYLKARKREKKRILHEFCHVTCYHRKSAIRLLCHPPKGAGERPLYRVLTVFDAIGKVSAVADKIGRNTDTLGGKVTRIGGRYRRCGAA